MNEKDLQLSALPPGMLATEFSCERYMDDFEAFKETKNFEEHELAIPKLKKLRKWRAARSTIVLRQQIEDRFPNKSRHRDGIIGGLEYCPGLSDHCPNIIENDTGVIAAIDITHDPKNGCDMGPIVHSISMSMDARIKYIIYDGQICRAYRYEGAPAWSWQKYAGKNRHLHHAHFSVQHSKRDYDSVRQWEIGN